MMRSVLIACSVAALLAAAPAQACMASGPDGYVSGLVWETQAAEIPSDAMSLRVHLDRPIEGTWMGFVAIVREDPSELVGKEIEVLPQNQNSCVVLGIREGYLIVRREQVEENIDGRTVLFFVAVDYLPSAENELQRRSGGDQWVYPGAPQDREELPF